MVTICLNVSSSLFLPSMLGHNAACQVQGDCMHVDGANSFCNANVGCLWSSSLQGYDCLMEKLWNECGLILEDFLG